MNRPRTILLLAVLGFLPASAQAVTDRPADGANLSTGDEAAALVFSTGSTGASAAIVAVSQVLVGNEVVLDGVNSLALIRGSFNDGTGIFGVNQDAGNFNNQANVVAFVMGGGDVEAQALSVSIEQERRDNVVITSNSTQQEIIDGSFNGTTGIVGVNQSAGSANNQLNAVAIGMGVMVGTDAVLLNDVDLEVVTGDDELDAGPDTVTPSIMNSFQDFKGIAQVSQASGNLNTVQNVVSVSVISVQAGQP